MMKAIKGMLLAVVMIISTAAAAQTTIAGGEYWIDGTIDARQALSSGASIDISTLQPGLHTLTVRVKDSNGLWSNQVARIFFVSPPGRTDAASVTACEYWLDGVKKPAYTTLNIQTIDISSLTPGLHTIMVRVKDDLGIWSNQVARIFFVSPPGRTDATSVTVCEYWLDGVKKSEYTTLNSQVIDISDLAPGLHKVLVRVKDDLGIWSNQMSRTFFVAPGAQTDATTITKREFWLDGDIVHRQTIDDTPAVIDISALDAGLHMMTMRVQDDKGIWSNQMARSFYVAPLPAPTATLARYMYWIDNDKEHAVTGDITDDSGQLVIDLEPLALEDGDHTLTWLVGDSKGAWSEKVIETFTVVTTGINNTRMPTNLRNDNWYDLSGRKLNGMPTRPGIYINNGRKIVVK